MIRPSEGLEIDGFALGACLHKGGFATIWKVTHPDHAQAMVMKVPTILDGYDAPTIVGFEVEQMILPRLSGPYVPKLIAVGDFRVMPYVVTEEIEGNSLLALFDAAPLPLSELIETAARMTEAVHELHKQHVVHLDLKPANFLQRPTGEMVCIDFGLSRHDQLPDLLDEEFTIPMGTFPYIAPEQYLRQRDDLRSDIFALGAIIYEGATGKMPFGKPERLRAVRKRLWRDPVPPRAIDPRIPEWLQEIILRALEVDPARRYQSAAQMLFDLQHPSQVRLTERGRKMKQDGALAVWRRWRAMRKLRGFAPPAGMSAQISKAPVMMVAVDLSPEMEGLSLLLLLQVKRMLSSQPDARVACVNVIKTARIGIDPTTTEDGDHLHVSRLIALRAWAQDLDLPDERLTFTILEHSNPAQAIVEHAAKNQMDHIVMGARSHSASRRYLGSVSSQVVAESSCSVTVIRLPAVAAAEAA
ncbi:universal stress protein [Gemmobacter straminiformis]|uniref:Universal stress protein n=2 Tax=Paragemmobacter straminiformis TaxID=2045119 RepID=A0A842I7I2_9RHOB|nr:universal stress protein [Gemmobacter straminiformis]